MAKQNDTPSTPVQLETKIAELIRVNTDLSRDNHVLASRLHMAEDMGSLAGWKYYYKTGEFFLSDEGLAIADYVLGNRFSRSEYIQMVHPDDFESLVERLRNPKVNDIFRFEHRVIVNGRTKYIHTKVTRQYVEDGYPVLEGYLQDMTAQVERRQELDIFQYAVNMANEEIYAFTLDGRMIFANRIFTLRYNLEPDITKYYVTDVSPLFDKPRLKTLMEDIVRNRGSLVFTTEHLLPDGKKLPVEVTCYLVKKGTSNEIWAFSRDISSNLSLERKVQGLNRLLESILNNVPAPIFVKDISEFRYLYWSREMEASTHITAAMAVGHLDEELYPNPEDVRRFRSDDMALLEGGPDVEYVDTHTMNNGKLTTVKVFKTLVHTGGRPLILGVLTDISEKSEAAQELIRARIEAEESSRLRSAFMANMSHEIRTPLNTITGFSRIIAETEDPAEKQRYYQIVEDNAKLLAKLINDVLDISSFEAGTLELSPSALPVAELCRRVVETYASSAAQGVDLYLEEDVEDVTAFCDANRLFQVLSNLIDNAARLTRHGFIKVGYHILGDKLEFYVQDSGPGIPKSRMQSIFERFNKLDPSAPGTGLGLPIAKMIVEKMGGEISVTSTEGKGSRFSFTVAYEPAARIGETLSAAAPKEGVSLKTILVAEDVESNYLLLDALIGKQYNLIRAHNGVQAVQLFKEHSPDAILMDIKMPEMNGITATVEIRKLSSTVPIVALTAFAFNEERLQLLNAGCDDYLTKPVSASQLRSVLSKYL